MGGLTLLLASDVLAGRGIDQVLAHPGDATLYEASVYDACGHVRLAERVNGPIARPLEGVGLCGDAQAVIDRVKPR